MTNQLLYTIVAEYAEHHGISITEVTRQEKITLGKALIEGFDNYGIEGLLGDSPSQEDIVKGLDDIEQLKRVIAA
jgi:hypothetical protein